MAKKAATTSEPDYTTFEGLFGPAPTPATGQSSQDPIFLAKKGDYADRKKRFIAVVPLGSTLDDNLRSESARSLATCTHYEMGQIVFYSYTQGTDKRVLGIAVPESPIYFAYPHYDTFRDSSGNFVSEFHRNMVNEGFAIFNPPGLHPFSNDETQEKNAKLVEAAEAERQAAIEEGLAGL